jgi:type IV pilus assembly protein PilA
MRQLLKKQEGFTLVELLAVIVILGIIAAIAIPAIGHIISNSRNKAEANDALQIIDAAKLYVTDGHDSVTSITPTELQPYLNSVVKSGSTSGSNYTFTTVAVSTDSNGGTIYTINGHTDPASQANGSSGANESDLNSWLSQH